VSRLCKTPGMRATVVVIGFALLLGACSGNDADPASVLADYEDARNSGDVDAAMAFYAENAIVKDHPLDGDGIANGVDEIRSLEAQVPGIQGSTGGIEFTDMVVSGNTVTFNHKFFNASGDCFGGLGGEVIAEDGKITLYDWGPQDPSQCG